MTRSRERFDINEQTVELRADDSAFFAGLDGPLHVLVLAEDWCGDVIANQPLKVSITYCAACGYEPQTLELTWALMHAFVYELASIELIPWQDGAFDVVVDGELVHSMYRDGGFPASATIIDAVRTRLSV